jgi:hypothetical protein
MKKTSTKTTSFREYWAFRAAEQGSSLYRPTDRWDREDGAAVKYSLDYYWANPVKPGHRGWIAFGPKDDHALFYTLRGSRAKIHRRWKTAQAAMAYIDEMYPVGTACGDCARGHPGDVGTVGIPG